MSFYYCPDFASLFTSWQRAKAIKSKDRWKVKITKHTKGCEICQQRINHKLTLADLRKGSYTKKNK